MHRFEEIPEDRYRTIRILDDRVEIRRSLIACLGGIFGMLAAVYIGSMFLRASMTGTATVGAWLISFALSSFAVGFITRVIKGSWPELLPSALLVIWDNEAVRDASPPIRRHTVREIVASQIDRILIRGNPWGGKGQYDRPLMWLILTDDGEQPLFMYQPRWTASTTEAWEEIDRYAVPLGKRWDVPKIDQRSPKK